MKRNTDQPMDPESKPSSKPMSRNLMAEFLFSLNMSHNT